MSSGSSNVSDAR